MEESTFRGEIVDEDGARFEVFTLPAREDVLLNLLNDCFVEWEHIRIGPVMPGALWEIRPPCKPNITLCNGYATVDFQDWQFHLCIGEPRDVRPEIAALRRTGLVELYRRLNWWGQPVRCGLRLLNGAGDQQISFMLPSPFITDDLAIMKEPDWGRLALWDLLCRKYLGLEHDPSAPTSRYG